jgi:sugar lactone lactonase YvrE
MLRVGAGLLVLAAAAGLLWLHGRRQPTDSGGGLGPSFRYDLSELQKVDPALLTFEEQSGVALDLAEPQALAVGPDDRIYAAGAGEAVVFAPDGTPERRFAIGATATCVAVARDGAVLVGLRDRVAAFAPDGRPVADWPSLGSNAVLTCLGVGSNSVYAADAGNRVVLRYDRTGALLGRIGVKDAERGIQGFVIPSPYFDLAALDDDSVWVVDPGRHRFVHFTPDGAVLSSWAKSGMQMDGFSGCCNPAHIARRPDGAFVTSEKGLVRVKVVGPTGELVAVVAGPESFAEGATGLDLAVDRAGRVLVLEPQAKKVRIFVEKKP